MPHKKKYKCSICCKPWRKNQKSIFEIILIPGTMGGQGAEKCTLIEIEKNVVFLLMRVFFYADFFVDPDLFVIPFNEVTGLISPFQRPHQSGFT